MNREIKYDPQTRDYAMYLDGELKGFAATYSQAERDLDAMVLDLIEQGLVDQPLAAMAEPAANRCATCGDEGDCPDCGTLSGAMLASPEGDTVPDTNPDVDSTPGTYGPMPGASCPTCDGQRIARQIHRDYHVFLFHVAHTNTDTLEREATAYASYMNTRRPKQAPITAEQVYVTWQLAVARHAVAA